MGCRFTQYDIMRLREKREEFQAAGAQLFVVIQSPVKTVEEHFDTSLLDMTLLCDPESRLYQRFFRFAGTVRRRNAWETFF